MSSVCVLKRSRPEFVIYQDLFETSKILMRGKIETLVHLKIDDKIKLQQGERHRLIGLAVWGVVAEIWQHTDASDPSDEDDIVRLQDDFGR